MNVIIVKCLLICCLTCSLTNCGKKETRKPAYRDEDQASQKIPACVALGLLIATVVAWRVNK